MAIDLGPDGLTLGSTTVNDWANVGGGTETYFTTSSTSFTKSGTGDVLVMGCGGGGGANGSGITSGGSSNGAAIFNNVANGTTITVVIGGAGSGGGGTGGNTVVTMGSSSYTIGGAGTGSGGAGSNSSSGSVTRLDASPYHRPQGGVTSSTTGYKSGGNSFFGSQGNPPTGFGSGGGAEWYNTSPAGRPGCLLLQGV